MYVFIHIYVYYDAGLSIVGECTGVTSGRKHKRRGVVDEDYQKD